MESSLHFLCASKNGVAVLFDAVHSHVATHFADKPALRSLVIEVLKKLELTGQEFAGHIDMGRVVGVSDVIAVGKNDEIIYAVRKNRDDDGLVPFVKNRQGDPCAYISVHLLPSGDDYLLSSAWIGTYGGDDEPFPLAADATERSKKYWDAHAFVYGSQEMLPDTKTINKPW